MSSPSIVSCEPSRLPIGISNLKVSITFDRPLECYQEHPPISVFIGEKPTQNPSIVAYNPCVLECIVPGNGLRQGPTTVMVRFPCGAQVSNAGCLRLVSLYEVELDRLILLFEDNVKELLHANLIESNVKRSWASLYGDLFSLVRAIKGSRSQSHRELYRRSARMYESTTRCWRQFLEIQRATGPNYASSPFEALKSFYKVWADFTICTSILDSLNRQHNMRVYNTKPTNAQHSTTTSITTATTTTTTTTTTTPENTPTAVTTTDATITTSPSEVSADEAPSQPPSPEVLDMSNSHIPNVIVEGAKLFSEHFMHCKDRLLFNVIELINQERNAEQQATSATRPYPPVAGTLNSCLITSFIRSFMAFCKEPPIKSWDTQTTSTDSTPTSTTDHHNHHHQQQQASRGDEWTNTVEKLIADLSNYYATLIHNHGTEVSVKRLAKDWFSDEDRRIKQFQAHSELYSFLFSKENCREGNTDLKFTDYCQLWIFVAWQCYYHAGIYSEEEVSKAIAVWKLKVDECEVNLIRERKDEFLECFDVHVAEVIRNKKVHIVPSSNNDCNNNNNNDMTSTVPRQTAHTIPIVSNNNNNNNNKYEELRLITDGLTTLLKRDGSSSVTAMVDCVAKHVTQSSNESLQLIVNDALKDPIVYINQLIREHSKLKMLYIRSFQNLAVIDHAIDKSLHQVINSNAVCQAAAAGGSQGGQSHVSPSAKSAEMIAYVCHLYLSRQSANSNIRHLDDNELEKILSDIVAIFGYLTDKDVFMRFYTKMLQHRLINNMSASSEAEYFMMNKMKAVCGYSFVYKLQALCQDHALAQELRRLFKDFVRQQYIKFTSSVQASISTTAAAASSPTDTKPIEFDCMVLTTSLWSLPLPKSNFLFPAELELGMSAFKYFYDSRFTGRKLAWLTPLCKAELIYHGPRRDYILACSTYQLGILLQFNPSTSITMATTGHNIGLERTREQLQNATNLTEDELTNVLMTLTKARKGYETPLLLVQGDTTTSATTNNEPALITNRRTRFVLNPRFNNNRHRININVVVRDGGGDSSSDGDTSDVLHKVNENRKILIQSAIVRIMKARKTLKHTQLITQVVEQLQHLFVPDVSLIKSCIAILIEKEYIERSSYEHNTYNYIS